MGTQQGLAQPQMPGRGGGHSNLEKPPNYVYHVGRPLDFILPSPYKTGRNDQKDHRAGKAQSVEQKF